MLEKNQKIKRAMKRVLLSVLIVWAALELILQAAHLSVVLFKPDPVLPHPGAPVILCVGDSHTYGVYFPPELSYPGRLQTLLDQGGYEINVVNEGVPGMNTSQLRYIFPGLIERYRPSVIVIWVCRNNKWNRSYVVWSDIQDHELEPGVRSWLQRAWYVVGWKLRTVRMVSYLANEASRRMEEPLKQLGAHSTREGEVFFHEWRAQSDPEEYTAVMRRTLRDLQSLIDMARQAGAEPVIMTYVHRPAVTMELSNYLLRSAAKNRGAILADNDLVLQPLFMLPDGNVDPIQRDRLFLTEENDEHLSADGYEVVAKNLLKILEQKNLVQKRPAEKPAE